MFLEYPLAFLCLVMVLFFLTAFEHYVFRYISDNTFEREGLAPLIVMTALLAVLTSIFSFALNGLLLFLSFKEVFFLLVVLPMGYAAVLGVGEAEQSQKAARTKNKRQ
ncbi:MAG: hypothetical protein K0S20_78 [Patescibacteria group bacterium]|jgi:hypothetical protein|nr:hypothetical protein [Patescibacteria group bacterium]